MPPHVRVTKQMILDAAFQLVRAQGHEAVTARRLAAALGCSTQPILYQFDSIEQIVEQTYRRADDYHTAFLTEALEKTDDPLMTLGLRYIRFGAEEKALFRFLFQSGRFAGKTPEQLTGDPAAAGLTGIVSASAGVEAEQAKAIFTGLFAAVHGYASLLANNAMTWEPRAAEALLSAIYQGLTQRRDDDEKTV